MKIIDFSAKGNVVRFWLGDDECYDYHGDDWDDAPYEHNAGQVYDEYIADYVDVVFPYDAIVTEPAKDWHYSGNSPYSKLDMRNRMCPCIVAISGKIANDAWDDSYSYWATSDNDGILKFYFGDKISKNNEHLIFVDFSTFSGCHLCR